MGLFDWLRGKRKRDTPTPAAGDSSRPHVTALGRISKFQDADGIGEITLDDGVVLRFGRSGCRGFEPVLDARVQVEDIGPHPLGGMRAVRVTSAPGMSAELDHLHDQRAENLGIIFTEEDAVSLALELGTVTVLLDSAPDEGRAGIRQLLEETGVLADGAVLEFTPRPWLHLGAKAFAFQVFVGRRPFPRDQLDLRFCGDDFDVGQGFICLSTGIAAIDVQGRLLLGPTTPDPWAAPDGQLRRLTLVAYKLLDAGRGVIVHRAGHVTYPAERWLRRIGDPSEPNCRPFGAWIDIGYTPDRTKLATSGMSASRHEDVAVAIRDPDSESEYTLAHDAAILACYIMTRDNRALEPGELIRLPIGLRIDAYGYHVDGEGTAETYEVSAAEYGFVLHPKIATSN